MCDDCHSYTILHCVAALQPKHVLGGPRQQKGQLSKYTSTAVGQLSKAAYAASLSFELLGAAN